MFTLRFETGNDAFSEHGAEFFESMRLLAEVRSKLSEGQTEGPIMDANGIKVGSWELV